MIIARALQQESISLQDFIDHNLEYLDGVSNDQILEMIINHMKDNFGISKCTISDLIKNNVSIDNLVEYGLGKDVAEQILSEAKIITKLLKIK